MLFLKMRMYLLVAAMFGIVYAIVTAAAYSLGVTSFAFYSVFTFALMLVQFMMGPKLIEMFMHVRYVNAKTHPELCGIVEELAHKANIPVPRVAISETNVPNAFAFGRWLSDGRVCVTTQIMKILTEDELKAVLGHELTHIKNRDVLTITLLSVVPLILYRIAFNILFFGSGRGRGKNSQNVVFLGLAALVLYFFTNLLVLYGSRIREYFADRGSAELGNEPRFLAQALYKLARGTKFATKEQLQQIKGAQAFLISSPSRIDEQIRDLSQLGFDSNGRIGEENFRNIRKGRISLNARQKFMELFSTHPNMLKRIKQLSRYQ